MISNLSNKMAQSLSIYVGRNTEVDYLRYGIEVIIRGFIKFLIIIIVAILFNLVTPMIAILTTFAFFRALTGGYHYSTYLRCLIVGLLIMKMMAFTSTKIVDLIDGTTILLLIIVAVSLGLYLSYKYAPSNHFYKEMSNIQKIRLKKIAYYGIILWAIVTLVFYKVNMNIIVIASIFSFIFQMSTIHPLSYLIVSKVESYIERR